MPFLITLLIASSDVASLHEGFLRGVRISGNAPCFGQRLIANVVLLIFISLPEYLSTSHGLAKHGLNSGNALGLYSINRSEWVIAEQAAYLNSYVTVPLYDTLGAEAIEYIVNQTEMVCIVMSRDKLDNLLNIKAKLSALKLLVLMDPINESDQSKIAKSGIAAVYFKDVETEGANDIASATPTPAKLNDLATICYTSGTTGQPKGVLLTQSNMLSIVNSLLELTTRVPGFGKDDVHISYLPLAHVMERITQQYLLYNGARIGFYQGDISKLLDDIGELKPTVFVSVPRLLNRIHDRVWAGVKAKGGIASALFQAAYLQKKAGLQLGFVRNPFWDVLVFSNVHSRLGGRVRFIISASAPISNSVMDFLRICFSCDVIEAYGQTETSGVCTIGVMGDTSTGNVGVPAPCSEIKLIDVPEMNYYSTDQPNPRGEICVRGNSVFQGYYKLPDKTAETLDKNGWCHTGDVGMWDTYGRLWVIDRVRNIFKLSQGEYVAAEKIENVYTSHELVAQAFVYGDSLQSCVVGIIVPDTDTFISWAHTLGYDAPVKQLIKNDDLRKKLHQLLVSHGKACGLQGFENVRAIYVEDEVFSVANDLLTPTLKFKRNNAKSRYTDIVEQLYKEAIKYETS